MASKSFTTIALFLAFIALFFDLTAAQTCPMPTNLCVDLLKNPTSAIGLPPSKNPCCYFFISGIGHDAAVACFCKSLKESVRGITGIYPHTVLGLCFNPATRDIKCK